MIRAAQSQYRDDVHSEILHITHPDDELLLALVHDFEKMRTESKYGPELACFFEQMPCDVMAIVGQQGKKVCPACGQRRPETHIGPVLQG